MRCFVLCALAFGLTAQPPRYTADAIVDAASGTPRRFAPNSLASLYGERLWEKDGVTAVVLFGRATHVLYASPNQINFHVPGNLSSQVTEMMVTVLRNGAQGDAVRVPLSPEAPEFFRLDPGYAAATDAVGTVLTAKQPARPGDIVVIYGTGFGATLRDGHRADVAVRADFTVKPMSVWLDGRPVPADHIFYAGLTPGYRGLYQLNLRLPPDTAADPELRAGFNGESSSAPVRLYCRPAPVD